MRHQKNGIDKVGACDIRSSVDGDGGRLERKDHGFKKVALQRQQRHIGFLFITCMCLYIHLFIVGVDTAKIRKLASQPSDGEGSSDPKDILHNAQERNDKETQEGIDACDNEVSAVEDWIAYEQSLDKQDQIIRKEVSNYKKVDPHALTYDMPRIF